MSTEGRKDDRLKARLDLVPADALMAVAWVLTYGAEKYAPRNWEKGMDWSRLVGAMKRHIAAFEMLENEDPETGFPHLAHAACCSLMLLSLYLRGHGSDDRADLSSDQHESALALLASMEERYFDHLARRALSSSGSGP